MTRRQRIERTEWPTAEPSQVARAFRNVQSALDAIPDQRIFVTAAQQYAEPMYLAIEDDRVPRIVSLARVLNVDSPTTPVAYGAVTWEFVGRVGGQIKIHDVVGMSTGATRYAFTWKVEW